MENKKFTKRAVVISIIAVLMCCTLLIGGTFAWFTDSVISGYNTIESGNLDVVLEYKTDWDNEWAPVTEDTKLFKEGALYEPGYTEVVFLRVSNVGNLALKYNLTINILDQTGSVNVAGEDFLLSDYLQMGYYVQDEYSGEFNYADILIPALFGNRDAAKAAVAKNTAVLNDVYVCQDSHLLPGEHTAQVVALVLNMPETVGNEANHLTGEAGPTVTLGINLQATQYTYEEDSFDNQYDKDAAYPESRFPGYIYTEEDLLEAIAKGGSYKLGSDIVLTGDVTSVTADTVLDLNGHKITADRNYPKPYEAASISTLEVIGASLTINGSGSIKNTAPSGAYALAIRNNGNVTVNGGYFESYHDAAYVDTGVLTINGGVFNATADTNPNPETNGRHNPNPINCNNDALHEGDAKVIMRGGSLVNCDPSNLYEVWGWYEVSFVAEGYHVDTDVQSDTYVLFNVVKD